MKLALEPIEAEELLRAKSQLKSSLFYNLERRVILAEDISRQTFVFGQREPARETCLHIDNITAEDIKEVNCFTLDSDSLGRF